MLVLRRDLELLVFQEKHIEDLEELVVLVPGILRIFYSLLLDLVNSGIITELKSIRKSTE